MLGNCSGCTSMTAINGGIQNFSPGGEKLQRGAATTGKPGEEPKARHCQNPRVSIPTPQHHPAHSLPIPSGMIVSTPSLPDREPFFCSAQNVSSLLGVWNDFPLLVTKSGLPFSSCYIINIYCLFNSSFPVSYLCILFLIGLRVLSGNN